MNEVELKQNRDDWQQVAETARLHSTGGADGHQWDSCECPSCFLHTCYKHKIAALNLRAESLDRVVGECGQRELVLEARVKELTEVMEKIVELSGKDNSFVQTGRLDDIHKIAKRR
jgi:hypothetical protein